MIEFNNRRQFMQIGAAACLASVGGGHLFGGPAERKKIAFLGTEVRTHSHSQHFLDRLAMGYAYNGQWELPRLDIASVFIDQHPENDLTPGRLDRYGLQSYDTIEDALTLGSGKLAVDGVVIIAEHGDYPVNDKGQRRYPRYEWFKRVVKVFEASGRSVPVFNDKHLSTEWSECLEMVEDSKRLGFPFMAGSSLPVTWRLPMIDMPHDVPLRESVCVCYGGIDSYDIHGLETAQCMSERRRGGEAGVASVVAYRGESLWAKLREDGYRDTRRLIEAALRRSHNLPVETGYPTHPVDFEWAQRTLASSIGYIIEHVDGFRTTMLLSPIRDFNYAGLRADRDEIVSCQMYLPMPTHGSTTADFFTPLVRHIEDLVLTGKPPYPIERNLLTSGMVIAGVNSLHRGSEVIATPEMKIAYKVGKDSTFWRE
ncbi:hypothetical protein SH449x_004455 [Pirellulaceae bacterium SH449]